GTVDLGRAGIATEDVDVESTAGLGAVERLRGESNAPEARTCAAVDRVVERLCVAVRSARAVTVDGASGRWFDARRCRPRVVAARELAVGNRLSVADELARAACRVRRIEPIADISTASDRERRDDAYASGPP